MPFWMRKNGGDWNADATADPATKTGGYPLTGLFEPLIPFGLVDNITLTYNFGSSAFTYIPPSGFTGWPNAANTGFTHFDATTLQGDVTIVPATNNLKITSGSTNGLAFCVTADQQGTGSFYWEFTFTAGDIFTTTSGGGVGIDGADLNFIVAGEFSLSDPNGGATIRSGSIVDNQTLSVWISGVEVAHNLFASFVQGDILSIAVTLESLILPGVSGTGEAGTIGVDIVDIPTMTMTGLFGTELYQEIGSNNLSLRWSDDGGNTWGNPLLLSMGSPGAFNSSLIFQNLGYSRDRIWELSFASDGNSALAGVFEVAVTADS